MGCAILRKLLFIIVLVSAPVASFSQQSSAAGTDFAVQDWWIKCHGDDPDSTCLTNHELAKFKTLCANKINKPLCRAVVNHAVAKARFAEGIQLLNSGFKTQKLIFSMTNSYSFDIEKIWDKKTLNTAEFFAVGVMPTCDKTNPKKPHFNNHVKADTKEKIQNIYELLINKPCRPSSEGFVLVVIGKVHDGSEAFEILTIDQNNTTDILSTAITLNPFVSDNTTTASRTGPN